MEKSQSMTKSWWKQTGKTQPTKTETVQVKDS